MAAHNKIRVCRLHELVVRDADGCARAFRYGDQVEITPELAAALGVYLESFEPVTVDKPTARNARAVDEQE